MFIVHVFVHVKPDRIEAFKAATLDNAHNSIQEPGVARFDVIQQQEMTLLALYWQRFIAHRMILLGIKKHQIIRNGETR